ncbi:MAG: mechanosensitive ion channel [Planctomycetaceae bacterium]|nr:mechanosensitive ion channel [Planctomycetaceae bacterium]
MDFIRAFPGSSCRCFLPALVLLCVSHLLHGPALAQDTAPPSRSTTPAPEGVSATEKVNGWLRDAEADTELSAEDKAKVVGIYRQILEELDQARQLSVLAATALETAKGAEARVQEIKREIRELPTKPDLKDLPQATLGELQQAVGRQEQLLSELRVRQTALESEPARRVARRREVRNLLAAQPERIADVKNQLQAPPPENEPTAVSTANRRKLEARQHLLEQENRKLQAEMQQYDAADSFDLIRSERDLVEARVRHSEARLAAIRELEASRRRAEAEARVRQARQQLSQQQPSLRAIASRNQELAEQARTVNLTLEDVTSDLEQTRTKLAALTRQFELTRGKVDSIGQTEAIGQLLRKQKADLPNLVEHRDSVRERQQLVQEAQLASFEIEEKRSDLTTVEAGVEELLADLPKSVVPEEREEVSDAAHELLTLQRELLDSLAQSHTRLLDDLITLDAAEKNLIRVAEDYYAFIDERVLWIQSSSRLSLADLQEAVEGTGWLFRPNAWRNVAMAFRQDLTDSPLLWATSLLLLALWLSFLGRMRKQLRQFGTVASRSTCQQFRPTVLAGLLTGVLAVMWPAVLWFAGWRLTEAETGDEFTRAVASGFRVVAIVLLPLQLLRQSCRSGGLATAHFGWSSSSQELLKRYLRVLVFFALPLLFVSAVASYQSGTSRHPALARVAFICSMLALSWCLHRLTRPVGGLPHEYLAANPGGLANRLRNVWYPLLVALPAVLGIISGFGYGFTAGQLVIRLFISFVFLLAAILLGGFLRRWLLISRRRIAIREARKRAAEAASTGSDSAGGSPIRLDDSNGVDLAAIDTQTRRLLNTAIGFTALACLYFTWVDTVPALRVFDRVELWQVEVEYTESQSSSILPENGITSSPAAKDSEDGVEVKSGTRWKWITLGSLFKALLIVILMVVSVRNLPGLLEIVVLRHMPIDAAARFAVTTLTSYAILIVGILFAFGTLGIGWAKVQWLAAALTLGVGFGLQEIFANFVSGLIILIERPIRVGDVVTIDDVTGIVSRIRIRATTITGWDRKELIVPNREFITGRLLNWTLTDSVNRVVLNVGVAYGSDTELARNLLLEQAAKHPEILKDPPPMAAFEEFGDSTLNFSLRVYLPKMDQRLVVIHDLHTAIDLAFRKAGIEIAFPQRDIHVRTAAPFTVSSPPPSESHESNGNAVEPKRPEPARETEHASTD